MLALDNTFGWISGRSAIPSYLRSLTYPLTDILLSSNCFQHARIPIMLYYQQPPDPFLHRLSPTSQVLWPRLTSAGSAMPCDMGYIFRCVSHRPPRLRCNSLHPMQPLHLRDRVRVVWDFDLSCSLVRSATPSYAVSVRRLGILPVRVDRFPLASGFLQIPPRDGHPCLRLTLPTTKRVVDFHHQVVAHAGRTIKRASANKSRSPFAILAINQIEIKLYPIEVMFCTC